MRASRSSLSEILTGWLTKTGPTGTWLRRRDARSYAQLLVITGQRARILPPDRLHNLGQKRIDLFRRTAGEASGIRQLLEVDFRKHRVAGKTFEQVIVAAVFLDF